MRTNLGVVRCVVVRHSQPVGREKFKTSRVTIVRLGRSAASNNSYFCLRPSRATTHEVFSFR